MTPGDRAKTASKQHKVQSGTELTSNAVKQGTQGVAKGGVEAADTVSHFQYAPTLIALFPVFASFFFGSHTEHWTDLILLGLVAIYLHNCVSVPWGYYKASRRRYKTSNRELMTEKQVTVESRLRIAELQAFGGLILGPLLGAFLLHYVRNTMARPANGLITNFNITVFVLAAELRPVRIAYEYLTKRSDALQQELTEVTPARYEELEKRIDNLLTRFHDSTSRSHLSPKEAPESAFSGAVTTANTENAEVNQIKYALKKFEKYEANSKYEIESRLYALERRMADFGTRTEPVSSATFSVMRVVSDIILLPVRLVWKLFTAPIHFSERLFHTIGTRTSRS